jgi:drug/metabolite transporter (DMT)-like permease
MESSKARERIHALGPGLIAATAFGISDTFSKMVFAEGGDVLTLAVTRGIVGLIIMFFYLRMGAPVMPATPRTRAFGFGLGVLFAAIIYGLFKAIELTTAPVAVLTYFIYPLLTGIAAAIFGVERLRWQDALAAVVAFLGLMLIIGANPQDLSIAGIAFAIAAALCRVTFLLIARTEMQHADPRLSTWHSLISSTAIFAVAAIATMNWHMPHSPVGWIAVAIVSVGTAVATLMLYMSSVRIGPFRSALIMNLEPLLVTILSAPLLGEVITPIQALGGAIMLAAIVAFQLRQKES